MGAAALRVPPDRLVYADDSVVIINDDFLKADYLPPESVDLVVTSPPYNVGVDYDSSSDSMGYGEYLEFTERWLSRVRELLKPDGRVCLNVPLDKSRGREGEGFQSVYADVVQIAKKVGLRYFSTVVWNEGNISRRTAWGSFASASAPYVIAPVEVVVILYKHTWKKRRRGASDITRDEFIQWTNGLWTFPGENPKKVGHPAPFPVELPRRCIKLFTYVGDVVLDPFAGSGTTLVAAKQLNRVGIGVDISRQYCEAARRRVEAAGGRRPPAPG